MPRPTDAEVWLRAWCAVASVPTCEHTNEADQWADACLASYRTRFDPPQPEATTAAALGRLAQPWPPDRPGHPDGITGV